MPKLGDQFGDEPELDSSVQLPENRVAVEKGLTANERKKALGTNLDYKRSTPDVRKCIIEARKTEWEKWLRFGAAIVVTEEQVQELINKGHTLYPTQWVDTDKNQHLKHTPDYKAKYKSRLVACGQFENCPELRTDSPTCSVEGINILLSWA